MIKRTYFASYNKYHDDGKMSFSWRHFTFTRTSFFASPEKAFAEALDEARKSMASSPGKDDLVHCIAFSRI